MIWGAIGAGAIGIGSSMLSDAIGGGGQPKFKPVSVFSRFGNSEWTPNGNGTWTFDQSLDREGESLYGALFGQSMNNWYTTAARNAGYGAGQRIRPAFGNAQAFGGPDFTYSRQLMNNLRPMANRQVNRYGRAGIQQSQLGQVNAGQLSQYGANALNNGGFFTQQAMRNNVESDILGRLRENARYGNDLSVDSAIGNLFSKGVLSSETGSNQLGMLSREQRMQDNDFQIMAENLANQEYSTINQAALANQGLGLQALTSQMNYGLGAGQLGGSMFGLSSNFENTLANRGFQFNDTRYNRVNDRYNRALTGFSFGNDMNQQYLTNLLAGIQGREVLFGGVRDQARTAAGLSDAATMTGAGGGGQTSALGQGLAGLASGIGGAFGDKIGGWIG